MEKILKKMRINNSDSSPAHNIDLLNYKENKDCFHFQYFLFHVMTNQSQVTKSSQTETP